MPLVSLCKKGAIVTQSDDATQPSSPRITDRRGFIRTGSGLSLAALAGLSESSPLSAKPTQLWSLKPPYELRAFDSNTTKTPDGFEIKHKIEEAGAEGIRAISTGLYKHRNLGDSYSIFSYVSVQYFKGSSPEPRAHARYTLMINGTKGVVSERKRIGDKLDMVFLADGKLAARAQRTVDVLLDNPFEGMADKEIYRELRAIRTAKLGMTEFPPTHGGTKK
jgi:hypothetical protein